MSVSPFSTKEGYAMREDTVVQLRQPGTFSDDPLTEVLGLGARRLLAQAVELEVTAFVEMHIDLTDESGCHRIVRHGRAKLAWRRAAKNRRLLRSWNPLIYRISAFTICAIPLSRACATEKKMRMVRPPTPCRWT